MSIWRFAFANLWREWRSGELNMLALALTLAVAAVSAVDFFSDRVEQALLYQGNELLAADLLIDSTEPLAQELTAQAQAAGLQVAHTLSFPSVVMTGDSPQLVQLKAVDAAYPLRGRLRLRTQPEAAPQIRQGPPDAGEIWVEPRLLPLLHSAIGDSLHLGSGQFRISGLIEQEPDRGFSLFALAPRVMLNLKDIPATGLLTPASRASYRLLLAGAPDALERFRKQHLEDLPRTARLQTVAQTRPEMESVLQRGSSYLALTALLTVLVSSAAVALASHQLVQRQANTIALMRCLGARSGFLRGTMLLRLLLLLLVTGLAGTGAGYLVQFALAGQLSEWLPKSMPVPSLWPLVTGLATGAITLLGFALPSLWRLSEVPPLAVMRRDLGQTPPGLWPLGLAAISALALLVAWQAADWKMAGLVLGGALLLMLLLALSALALRLLLRMALKRAQGIWRYALTSLTRNTGLNLLQVCGFGLGIMAIMLLTVVRIGLLDAWEKSIPAEAPNQFLINIQPEQRAAVADFLTSHGLAYSGLHPMVRGRLIAINGAPVDAASYTDPRAARLVSREFNLSWGMQPQADNRIIAGKWWTDANALPQFSVEQGIAETLGIKLGDRLTYQVADQPVSAPVTSLRKVRWDSFNANFFVIASPDTLRDKPTSYITSFFLPEKQTSAAAELIREFSNLTLLDVSALLKQIKTAMDRGSHAVQSLFIFTLLAGLLVLYTGVLASARTRRHEIALLRTLGASRAQLFSAGFGEFTLLGLQAGMLGSSGAVLTGWLLAVMVFDLEYTLSPSMLLFGTLLPALAVGLAGALAVRPLVLRVPMVSLRLDE